MTKFSIKTLKFAFPIIAVALVASCSEEKSETNTKASSGQENTREAAIANIEPIAVLYKADWCGSCKVLDPKVQEAKKLLGNKLGKIKMVDLDLTNDATKAASAKVAESLGIKKLYDANAGKTGQLVIIDTKGQTILSKINKTYTAQQIADKVSYYIK